MVEEPTRILVESTDKDFIRQLFDFLDHAQTKPDSTVVRTVAPFDEKKYIRAKD